MPFDTIISALNYDHSAFAQKRCAEELVKMLTNENIASFIDIGAGTGFATLEILKKFPKVNPILLDKSSKMLEIAQSKIPNAVIINADAEIFNFSKYDFDLVVANLSMQWFKNFEIFLQKILSRTKYFAFSVPLNGSFEEYINIFKSIEIPNIKLYTQEEIANIVQKNAEIVKTKQITIAKTYPNAIEAARHFRNIGATISTNAEGQSKIVAKLKAHKKSVEIIYDCFLCILKCRSDNQIEKVS